MRVKFEWSGSEYEADLAQPIPIAIPLQRGFDNQPNAFGAPLYEATPLKDGDFTGSIEAGSPVNFYNIRLNPHGNGTHTESVGHILAGNYPINQLLTDSIVVAELVSVYPKKDDNGDRIITEDVIRNLEIRNTRALIVRTLPNDESKLNRKYSGTNPPYFTDGAIRAIVDSGVVHLLTDLPSVDREEDEGALKSHKMFWDVPKNPATFRTITELIYVDNSISDGLYLLNLQIAPLNLDASPSRPLLFRLEKTK